MSRVLSIKLETLYSRGRNSETDLFFRTAHGDLFRAYERVHDCTQPASVVYGNDPVAAIGIVFKANMFITFLQMGLANGVQPLLGYNYGSGDMERFQGVERYTKKCCIVAGVIATVLYFVLREPIIRLFISDEGVVSYGVEMLVAYMLSGPVIGILFVNMNCMQSVGHAFPATVLSVLRQGILLIPLLYLLRALFGLNGVILGQSVTDYIAVVLSIFLWRRIRSSLPSRRTGQ